MKKRIIVGILFIVLGALIAIGPQTLFPVCPVTADKVMKCFYTGRAEIGVGTLIAVLGILLIVISSPKIRIGLSVSIGLSGIFVITIPTVLIGVCGMATMQCHILTQPVLIVLGILTVIAAALNTIYLYKTSDKETE